MMWWLAGSEAVLIDLAARDRRDADQWRIHHNLIVSFSYFSSTIRTIINMQKIWDIPLETNDLEFGVSNTLHQHATPVP